MKKNYINRIVSSLPFQYSILFVIAFAIWLIFYPGLMSPDSLAQYEQGNAWRFDDWHPPLMSMILGIIIKLGGGIGLMIFIQCLAAVFGLRSVVSLLLRFFSEEHISKTATKVAAIIVTILFLVPFFTPYMLFSVMFWKDAWVGIISLWVISYLLWLILNQESLNTRNFLIHIVLLSLSSALLVLIRHNSIVMLPVICIFLAILGRLKFGKRGLLALVLPLIFAFVLNPIIYSVLDVKRVYVSNAVLASDMAVFLWFYPELDAEYPLSARHKNSPIVLLTKDGGVWNETTEGKQCPYLDKKICNPIMPLGCFGNTANTLNYEGNDCYMPVGKDNLALKDEYYKALTTHPFKLLNAKIYLFKQMLDPIFWHDPKVLCVIPENPIGLKLNYTFVETREGLCSLTHGAVNKWYVNWISGIHLLWLVLDVLFVIYFAIKSLFKRDNKSIFLFLLFLIPLSYYLSYVMAATTPDYRFMYPSTLMMQALTGALLLSIVLRIFQRRSGNTNVNEID